VICLVLGLAALVTPLTPGAWLALIGLELLGLHFLIPRPLRVRWFQFKKTMKDKILEIWKKWRPVK